MVTLAVLFGLLSMSGYAVSNVSAQPLARKFGNAQLIFLRGLTVITLLAVASVYDLNRLHDLHYVFYALLLGAFGYLPALAFTHGIKISRVGIVSPIASCSPLVAVLLSFFILETPISMLRWFAVALIVVANIGASVNPKSLKGSKLVSLAGGVPYALLAAAGWGVFYFALVYPTRALGPWLSAFLAELGVTAAAGVHLLVGRQRIPYDQAFSPKVIGNGVAIVIGTVAFTVGVSKFNVGIVAALSNSVALLSLLLAAYFFREKLNRLEAVAALLMIVGVVLLSIPSA